MICYLPAWIVLGPAIGTVYVFMTFIRRDHDYRNKFYAAFWFVSNALVFFTEWLVVVPAIMWNHLYNFGILLIGYPFLIYLYFKLALNPPKDVDRAPDDIPNIYQFANHLTEENFRHTEANRWCPTCLVHRPKSSKHCVICGKCIGQFDHHCYWIDCCVGAGNHRTFYVFLWIFAVGIWASIRYFEIYLSSRAEVAAGDGGWYDFIVLSYTHYPWFFSLYVSMTTFTPFLFVTALSQMYCIMIGVTLAELLTREYKKRADVDLNPFRMKSFSNLMDFLKGVPLEREYQDPEDR